MKQKNGFWHNFWKTMATPMPMPWDNPKDVERANEVHKAVWSDQPIIIINNNTLIIDRSRIKNKKLLRMLDDEAIECNAEVIENES